MMTDGYLDWVRAHPEGFVLNLRDRADSNYVVLHRAKCWTISDSTKADGAYTERSYRKGGAISVDDLRTIARQEGRIDRSFSKCCALRDPLA